MSWQTVDYDALATGYHDRYRANPLPGVEAALLALAGSGAARVLEVGCGTGRWLNALSPEAHSLFGLDRSAGMLRQAATRVPGALLVQGDALRLPFLAGSLEMLICINALHHFEQPRAFIREARRALAPGGRLALVGLDPHRDDARWSLYDYFPGTRETDLIRYPPPDDLKGWFTDAGLEMIESRPLEHLEETLRGRSLLDSPFLQKGGTSQLALLSTEAYRAGIARIEADLEAADVAGRTLEFHVNLYLHLTVGAVPEAPARP